MASERPTAEERATLAMLSSSNLDACPHTPQHESTHGCIAAEIRSAERAAVEEALREAIGKVEAISCNGDSMVWIRHLAAEALRTLLTRKAGAP